MHLLRFPNSGIRAKVARRRGGQPRQAPCRASHPRKGRGQGPYKGAVGYGQGQPAREAGAAHRGSSP
ncbi:hypothetical protein B296_00038126 [Ensete ventricosum]|uniref:Uncharacterized protein n=1 Tax=Ensete ventricosum TaxID=4639 RepID=A0A426Z2F6_ENSVE|nr:hypothetical protein B296_00038126 [Ensete ventricosum]